MKRELILAEFLSTPWALAPERLAAFESMLYRWQSGAPASPEVMAEVQASVEARVARQQAVAKTGGGIAVLPLYGVVTQRGNMAGDVSGSGGASTQKFTQAFRAAMADDSVSSILIDVDSPGGSVYGLSELATEIFNARGKKQVVSVANSLAASGGYWIGCAASEFYVTPGGEVGSIGVIMAHNDKSAAMEKDGVKTTYITAGKYKAEGNSSEPLTDEAMAFMQSRVDDYYAMFTKSIAKSRNASIETVRSDYGQGRTLGAKGALDAGMVDGIMTFDEVIAKMFKQPARSASRLAQAQNRLKILG